MMQDEYDFIIAGGGLAGLSLAIRLATPEFSSYRIAILDKSRKDKNDRTWSFWTTEKNHRFSSIFRHKWERLAFYAPGFERVERPAPYYYASLRGIDFYNYAWSQIKEYSHITFIQTDVSEIIEKGDHVICSTSSGKFSAPYVFDSIVRKMPINDPLFLWQHFLGWEIELDNDHFDPTTATFMDFRVDQCDGPTFVYVLPFDKRSALVEVTLFSRNLLSRDDYEQMLRDYLDKFLKKSYTIRDAELGKIPMTTASFGKGSDRIIPIGTNNATVKASTGYAFTRIENESDLIIDRIRKNKISKVRSKRKFTWYDRTLLNVITTGKEDGRKIFSLLFQRNKMAKILKFLDDQTSLLEETHIFSTLPFWSFLRAFTVENVVSFAKSDTVSNS